MKGMPCHPSAPQITWMKSKGEYKSSKESENASDIVCILSYHLLNCNEALPISLRVFCNELHRNHDLGHESGSKPCWLAEHVTMDTQYIL
ncbi:hypothetical protein T08_14162 [Trichinella sp. T8]|nr:hypothetical protein T08_14162 [Trichinella sp. T8]